MKYRSLHLLLPMWVITFSAYAGAPALYRPATVYKPQGTEQKRTLEIFPVKQPVKQKDPLKDRTLIQGLTQRVSRWEVKEARAKSEKSEKKDSAHSLSTFVVFGSESKENVMMHQRPMTAYRFEKVDGCLEPIIAERFMPGELVPKKTEKHCIKSTASKSLDASKKAKDEVPPKSKRGTELFNDLMAENERLVAAPSASIIGLDWVDNRKGIIKQLTPEVHKMIVALQFQERQLAQTNDHLQEKLKAEHLSNDFVFYMHTLLQHFGDSLKLFTPEELLLGEKAITINGPTLELIRIPRRAVQVIDKETGKTVDKTDEDGQPILQELAIPLKRCVDTAEETYASWYSEWGKPQDASDLLATGEELKQIKQRFQQTTDPSVRAHLATQQQQLKERQSKLVDGIKEKMLTCMKENERKNDLQAFIEGEEEDIKGMQARIASMLLPMTADERQLNGTPTKEAIKKQFAVPKLRLKVVSIDDRMASELAARVDEEQKKEDAKAKESKDSEKNS